MEASTEIPIFQSSELHYIFTCVRLVQQQPALHELRDDQVGRRDGAGRGNPVRQVRPRRHQLAALTLVLYIWMGVELELGLMQLWQM